MLRRKLSIGDFMIIENVTNNKIFDYLRNLIKHPRSFLLKNLGVRQTIAKNIFWLAVAEAITRLLKFILVVYIARIFGAVEYGKFTFALGFISLFVILSDLNIFKVVNRDFAKDPEKEKDFAGILSLEFLLSFITLAVVLFGSFFITVDQNVRRIIWILSLYTLLNIFPNIFFAFARARQRMEYQSWMQIASIVVIFIISLLVIFLRPSIFNLSLAYLAGSFLGLILIFVLFHFKIQRIKLEFNWDVWKKYLLLAAPFALNGLVGGLYSNFDTVIIGHYGYMEGVGQYNAAMRLVGVSLIPAGFISMSYFPVLSKAWVESKEKLKNIWTDYMAVLLALALPLFLGGLSLSEQLIGLVFGADFVPAGNIFSILLLSSVLALLTVPYSHIFVVADKVKTILYFNIAAAIVNILLNLALVAEYSFYGAVVANLLMNFTLAGLFLFLTNRLIGINLFTRKLFSRSIIVLLASLIMYFVIGAEAIINLPILLTILIGVIVYVVSLSFILSLFKRIQTCFDFS